MRIAVTHAYSRTNAGDGLLVDLTLERLARAGVRADDVVVFAMDPESFGELPHVVKLGTRGRSADLETAGAVAAGLGVALARRDGVGRAARVLAGVDAIVAVGGGYLRTGTRVNAFGAAINHVPALRVAATSGRPSIYLPQSVGPLSGRVGAVVRSHLSRVGEIHVRDDRSLAELGAAANVRRTPDLAVLDVAEKLGSVSTTREIGGTPLITARALGNADGYPHRLHALAARLGSVGWAVQAEGAPTKSDRAFYEAIGVRPDGRLRELLATSCGPVVSVRLHGALESILAGVPAVHLGYERKSWGAYEDLGLTEWVHSARSFDPDVVAEQVRELRADPSRFWAAVESRASHLRDRSAALDESIGRTLRGVSVRHLQMHG